MEVEIYSKNTQYEEIKPNIGNIEKLDQTIARIAEREGFITYKIEKRCVSTNGGNYLGDLFEYDVKGRTKNEAKELHLFVKKAMEGETVKVICMTDIYSTEAFVYKDLYKVFEELQEEANIPIEDRYQMVKGYEESDDAAIIMENVTKKGFNSYNRLDVVSLEFAEICIKELAKFHGLSFVLEERQPEYFDKHIKIRKTPYIINEDLEEMIANIKKSTIQLVDEKYKKQVDKAYDNIAKKFKQYFYDESIKVCLCHGDYRPNNIMTKIHEGKIQKIIPVDYQLMYYGSPVFDFLYYIYLSTDRDFRKTHLNYLKELYYDTLRKNLKLFNMDVDKVYPRQEFESVYEKYRDFGLTTALNLLPFVLASETDVPDVTKGAGEISFNLDERYENRLRGVIEDYVELGYLQD